MSLFNFDNVTAPAIPSGMTVASVVTSALQSQSAPNSVTNNTTNAVANLWIDTADGNSGNGLWDAKFLFLSSGQGLIAIRGSNKGWSNTTCYFLSVFPGDSSGIKIVKRIAGVNTTLPSGQVGSGSTFTTNIWYHAYFTANGTALSAKVQRLDTNQWLQPNATWGASQLDCIAVADASIAAASGFYGLDFFHGTLVRQVFSDDLSFSTLAGSFTIAPANIYNNSTNVSLTLTGTNESWVQGTTGFNLSGVAGASVVSVTVTSSNLCTVVINTGAATGTLTLTETGSGSAVATTTVNAQSMVINPTTIAANSTGNAMVVTGTGTQWSGGTVFSIFSQPGSGAAISAIGVPNATSASFALNAGNTAGSVVITDGAIFVTVTVSASSSFSIAPQTIYNNRVGNTLTLVGSGTTWTGSTTFTPSGVAGVVVTNKVITDATHATLTVTTGAATGLLTLTEGVTGTAAAMTNVAPQSMTISPGNIGLNSSGNAMVATGVGTQWSGTPLSIQSQPGSGAAISSQVVVSATSITFTLAAGNASGNITITDGTNLFVVTVARVATTLYVDPVGGNDANDGLTTLTPWKTAAKINSSLIAGDKCYLKGGTTLNGNISLHNLMGSVSNVTTLDSYGGSMATVLQSGSTEAILIRDCEFVTIQRLNVLGNGTINAGGFLTWQSRGIYFKSTGVGGSAVKLASNHAISNNVKGFNTAILYGSEPAGYVAGTGGNPNWVGYQNCKVIGNEISFCGCGIFFWGITELAVNPPFGYPAITGGRFHRNCQVISNYIHDNYGHNPTTPGDYTTAISGHACRTCNGDYFYVMYNVADNVGHMGDANTQTVAGIEAEAGFYGVYAHNRISNVIATIDVDGMGMDVFDQCQQNRAENNLIYNVDGPGVGGGSGPKGTSQNNYARNNIIINAHRWPVRTGQNSVQAVVHLFALSNGFNATNNTFYLSGAGSVMLGDLRGSSALIKNNIFLTEGGAAMSGGFTNIGVGQLLANCYWQTGGVFSILGFASLAAMIAAGFEAQGAVFGDPKFNNKGGIPSLANGVPNIGYHDYDLQSGSAAAGAGLLDVSSANQFQSCDFHLLPIDPSQYSMGACQTALFGQPTPIAGVHSSSRSVSRGR